jgi:hypothetical protein
MRKSAKLGLAALASAILLASFVSTASARNLSTSDRLWRASWNSLEFVATVTIRCRVTLEGSFHSQTIAKVARSLIGSVTRVTVAHPCSGGEAWADNGIERQPLGTAPNRLPFHLTYEGFRGTLPRIEELFLLLSRGSFVTEATVLGFNCRGRYGNATDNISSTATREAGGGIREIIPIEGRNTATLVEQLGRNAVCPATGRFRGASGPIIGTNTGRTLTITLI